MSGNLTARLPGYRPNGSAANGMPGVKAYAYKGFEGWDPYRGVHLDKAQVMAEDAPAGPRPVPTNAARLALAARMRAERQARIAECARLLESGLTPAQAAEELGVKVGAVYRYQREIRGQEGAS